MGRPSIYNRELATEICTRMALGETLRRILKEEGMPSERIVYQWRQESQEFSQIYAQARVDQMHAWADEIIHLVDDAETGYKIEVPLDSEDLERIEADSHVEFKYTRRHLEHAKAMAHERKWLMTRLDPETFGDKSTVNVNVQYEDKDDDELMSELQLAADRAGITPEQLVAWVGENGTVQ